MKAFRADATFWAAFDIPNDDDPLWQQVIAEQSVDVETKLEIAKLWYLQNMLQALEEPLK